MSKIKRRGFLRAAAGMGLAGAALAQQAPFSQPGTKFSEDQLRQAVAPSRVGKKLTPKAWPNGARVAVCLSFDVDNESYLLARGETSPTTLSAADFGAQSGLPRILRMLDSFQIPAGQNNSWQGGYLQLDGGAGTHGK